MSELVVVRDAERRRMLLLSKGRPPCTGCRMCLHVERVDELRCGIYPDGMVYR